MEKIRPAEESVSEIVNCMHTIAQANAPVEASLGLVLSPPPEIEISWNDIILTKENLYIDSFLMMNYTRNAKGEMIQDKAEGKNKYESIKGDLRTTSQPKRGGAGKPSFVSHSHKIDNSYKGSLEGDFEAEDVNSTYTEEFITTDFGIAEGDIVVLLPTNKAQQFIILCKVEYLGGDGDDASGRPFKF